MKMCRKYPVTFEQYKQKHFAKYGDIAVESRYIKAKFVYSCLKHPLDVEPFLRKWSDADFGELKKPEDAFEIWWDC